MTEAGPRGFLEVLNPDARREVLLRARTLRARKGQIILAQGEQSREVFILQEGRLRVVLYGVDGREVSLRDLREGQMFGELSAIDNEARSVSIVATEDTRLLAISGTLFRSIVIDQKEAADWLIRRLTGQIRNLTDRVFEMTALSVRARLHCELLRLAQERPASRDRAPTHAELANRIGTHREAITRELRALAEQGVIRSGRQHLEFLNIETLEDLVAESLRSPFGAEAGW